jgi:competence protein ComEC
VPAQRVWSSAAEGHPVFGGLRGVERCTDGTALDLGAMQLRLLHPHADDYAGSRSTNAMSCVLQDGVGPHRVLLTGDLPQRQELEMIERHPDLKSALVTAPHHGSSSSSSAPFIEATRPGWVVYQAGYRNRRGYPASGVTAHYAATGTRAVRTDAAGATQWRMGADGSILTDSMRAHHARCWLNRTERRRFGSNGGRPFKSADGGADDGANGAADRADAAAPKRGAPMSAPFGRWPSSCDGSC